MTVEHGSAGDGGKGSLDFQHEGEGSIFSQNLELDFNVSSVRPAGRQGQDLAADGPDPEERMTYFQVEAAKIVDILREELERFGASQGNQAIVDELWYSWRELWGAGLGPVEQEFTALFRAVRSACESTCRRGSTELAQPEQLALSRLMQGMEKLASGESDEEDLQWCREAGNRVLRMIAAWDNIEESRSMTPRKPIQQPPEEDITGSIDEWFSQVSRFIPQSSEEEEAAKIQSSGSQEEVLETGEQEPDWEFQLGQITAPADFGVVVEIEKGDLEALEDEPDVSRVPDEPLVIAGTVARDTVTDEKKVEAEGQQKNAVSEDIASESPEDIIEQSTSEGWLSEVYFCECCLEVAEAIRNNADRLEGHSATRTARMLSDWLEYLLQLSADFGITEADKALNSLWSRLEEVAAGGPDSRGSDAAKVEELLSALSNLERECEKVALATC